MNGLETFAMIAFAGLLLALILFWYKKVPKAVEPTQVELRVSEREQRIIKLYQNLEDLMDSFESYVDEEKHKLAQEIAALRTMAQHPGVVSPSSQDALTRQPLHPPIPARVRQQEPEVIVEISDQERAGEMRPPLSKTPMRLAPIQPNHPKPAMKRVEGGLKPSRQRSAKAESVLRLHAGGASPEEIAQSLNLAMGEIMLILGMYENHAAQGTS